MTNDEKIAARYYVRNKSAGYLGNSFIWYAKNGKGYTAYISGAERFERKKAETLVQHDPDKWEMYECAEIDKRLHFVFDSQDVKNLGTENSGGWKNGYAPTIEELRKKILCEIYTCADYLVARKAVAELSGLPATAVTFDKHIETIKAMRDENVRLREVLKKISCYDLYDCAAVEDVNFQEEAKLMYNLAYEALKGGQNDND